MDELLVVLVARLRARGVLLAGAIQHNTDGGDRCRCDMTLEDLASGTRVDISERRGPESRGCRLDSYALETSVGLVAQSLETPRDLVILNRFGKREADGRGFRQVIDQAIASDVPLLVAVSQSQLDAWQRFTGGIAGRLSADINDIDAWCNLVMRLRNAERAATRPASSKLSFG